MNDHARARIRSAPNKCARALFGAARDAAGHSEVDLSLHAPTDAANAFEQVLSAYPELRRFGRSLLFAVNQEYAPTGSRSTRRR